MIQDFYNGWHVNLEKVAAVGKRMYSLKPALVYEAAENVKLQIERGMRIIPRQISFRILAEAKAIDKIQGFHSFNDRLYLFADEIKKLKVRIYILENSFPKKIWATLTKERHLF
ncbi:MAG: hypothetical protein GY834_03445 [Bacteroidetes bacterium]|nr:hypothetical protein [Bacteroidota bacterium]